MAIIFIITSAVLLAIVLLVYLRYIGRRHVASLFRTTIQEKMAAGSEIGPAMQESVKRLRRRPPFDRIDDGDLSFFLDVLQDLHSPVEVGGEILQNFDKRYNASDLRDRSRILQLAYSTDLRLSLHQLIRNAGTLHRKLPRRYPNLTLALLASLSIREGWTFIEEGEEDLLFEYRRKNVRISKHGSGKDAARLILFEEMAQRPILVKTGKDYETRNAARHNLMVQFDSLFDKVFQNSSEQ